MQAYYSKSWAPGSSGYIARLAALPSSRIAILSVETSSGTPVYTLFLEDVVESQTFSPLLVGEKGGSVCMTCFWRACLEGVWAHAERQSVA